MIKRKHVESIVFWLALTGALLIEGLVSCILI